MKKIFAILLAAIMLVSLTACSEQEITERYAEFFESAKVEYATPGVLDSDFVPQGICYIENCLNDGKIGVSVIVGYMSNGGASRIYIVTDLEKEVFKWFTLQNADGSDYTGHAGGVAFYGDYLWIVSGSQAYRLNFSEALSADSQTAVKFTDSFDLPCGGAYCFIDEEKGILWIGEFYESKDYQTTATHHFVTDNNDKNYAIAVAYELSITDANGVKSTTPSLVLSLREKVQGFAYTQDGQFVLSTSYGRKNDSYLYFYDDPTSRPNDATMMINGEKVDVYYLDSAHLTSTLKCPPMTEGIALYEGRLLVLFESYAEKYRSTGLYPLPDVYSISLEK